MSRIKESYKRTLQRSPTTEPNTRALHKSLTNDTELNKQTYITALDLRTVMLPLRLAREGVGG